MYKKFTILLLFVLCMTSPGFSQASGSHSLPPDNGPGGQQSKVVKAYPNPASTQINFEIQNNNDGVYEIIVYNFLGKRIDDIKSVSGRYTVNLDKYFSGIYIYQLRDDRGNLVESGKFNVIK